MASLSPDDINQRASSKNLKVHFDLPEYENQPIYDEPHSGSDSSPRSNDSEKDAHESNYPSPVWNHQIGLPPQSPPIQVMAGAGYEENRIPLSIFSSKPANPMEWSVTSNESLFSLHLGNISFSRDQVFALYKSGELPRTDELSTMSVALPTVEEVVQSNDETERHSEEISSFFMEKDYDDRIKTSSEASMVVSEKTPENYSKEAMVPSDQARNSTSVSYRSEESMTSIRSFQFPILVGKGGRNSSVRVDSQKLQEPEKPLKPSSPKIETAPKPRRTNWCHCCFCCCLPYY